MAEYINKTDILRLLTSSPVWTGLDAISRVNTMPNIDIVMCPNCRKCKEQGGHANCNGYLYCTRQKTMVDEDCFCSWGEER